MHRGDVLISSVPYPIHSNVTVLAERGADEREERVTYAYTYTPHLTCHFPNLLMVTYELINLGMGLIEVRGIHPE